MNQEGLKIGFARRDITPPLGVQLFGYPKDRAATEVRDPLSATVAVVQNGTLQLAVVAVDWCLVDEEETAKIRVVAREMTGIPENHVVVCASHTHSGPVTVNCWGWGTKNQEYLDSVRPRIGEAIAEAQASLQSARLGVGTGKTAIGINRREVLLDGGLTGGFYEAGVNDDTLTVLRFEGAEGLLGQIVHMAAHPTTRGIDSMISRDWPGIMVDRLEQVSGKPVLFLNGAFGDIAPRTSVRGCVGDGDPAANEVGLRAANDAVGVFHSIKEFRPIGLDVFCGTFEMPFSPMESLETAEREREALREYAGGWGLKAGEFCFWSAVCEAYQSRLRSGKAVAQTVFCLGPVAFVPFSGEVFAETSLRLRHYSPFPSTLCLGTSNGCDGYYATREARGRGGYEVLVGRSYGAYQLADHAEDVLVSENVRLLKSLHDRCENQS